MASYSASLYIVLGLES